MTGPTLERLHKLADPGSFEPFDGLEAGGAILGTASMGGRRVHLLLLDTDQPPRISLFQTITRQTAFLEHVLAHPAPLVQVLDVPPHHRELKGKTPIPPDALSLLASADGVGRTYALRARLEGVVPRACLLFGPIGAALSFYAALCDATVMLESASLCIGRPDAVTLMTGQQTTMERLGGARMQASATGTAHRLTRSEDGAVAWVRQWLGFLPEKNGAPLPTLPPAPPRGRMAALAAADPNAPFPLREFLEALVDGGSWLEMGELHAGECRTGFCRLGGRPVAVLASDARTRGGILFPETCRKMARFVRFCGWFGLPTLFLADTPGFMVGEEVERQGNVQAAADLYTAIARSPAPKACLVLRKAYSAGLYAMAGAAFDAAFWAAPGASISVFGPEALRRFGQDRHMPEPARMAAADMLEGALHPELLVQKGLLHGVVPWERLRETLTDFSRQA
jgi:acetyl-CoA carboxylase carboxyltransferase component